jgi:TPR repeat protein
MNLSRRKERPQVFLAPYFKNLLGVFLVFAMLLNPSAKAIAADDEVMGGFFSYLPSAPEIKLPHIDLVPFWTDDLKAGKKAYAKTQYGKAMRYFRKASDEGNIVADWYLGHHFRLGLGVEANQAVAYSYYQRVAETFDSEEPDPTRLRVMVDAQLRVANYQRSGIAKANLAPNPKAAARTFLRLATAYAHPGALYALGVMSIEGEAMAKNPQQGLKWLNAAVRKRSPEAAAYLADLYAKGRIVKQDDTRALMWTIIAAEAAKRDELPDVFANLSQRKFNATEEVRIEAEARARVWSEENPAPIEQN